MVTTMRIASRVLVVVLVLLATAWAAAAIWVDGPESRSLAGVVAGAAGLFISFWGPTLYGHTIASWEFADGQHLAISEDFSRAIRRGLPPRPTGGIAGRSPGGA